METGLPERFGRYAVIARIHRGTYTAVYRVRRPGLARELSLKTAAPGLDAAARETAVRGLRREARARADLDHPGILALFDRGRSADGPYLVGPYLTGGTFAERFRGAAPGSTIVAFAEAVAAGLDALHARGWVHADLSPRNVLFDAEGRPRIADLGSCVRRGARWRTRSRPGPRWLVTRLTGAPEIWAGEPIDGRADLYAFAVLLYFLCTGTWPFSGRRTEELIELHASAPVPAPSSRRPEVGAEVDRVLLRALAKSPAERYPSGAALVAALGAALGEAAVRASGPGEAAVRRAGPRGRAAAALRRYMEGLAAAERRRFAAVLEQLERQGAQARASFGSALRGQLAPLGCLLAAEELGLLSALAQGPMSTAALAAACGLPEASTGRLCQGLRAAGEVTLAEDGWRLRAELERAYGVYGPEAMAPRPVAYAWGRWREVGRWVRTLEPPAAMDRGSDGEGYAASVAQLADSSAASARAWAEQSRAEGRLPDRAAILDVGAGSAVWSLALAEVFPEARITALDRPKVLAVAQARARAAGLAARLEALAGDWRTIALPRAGFGVIVLANVCHLLDAGGLAELIGRLAQALTEAGRIVVIDTIPERLEEAPAGVIHYDLELALRTERGQVHARTSYVGALAAAGLAVVDDRPLPRRAGSLRVLVAAASNHSTRSSSSDSGSSSVTTWPAAS